jgi:hypothetical protein
MGIITNYEAPAVPGRFKDDVAELIATGENAAYELIAPTEAEKPRGRSIASELSAFQDEARAQGRSAKVAEREELPDNTTRLVIVLRDRRTRTVKPKDTEKSETKASK